MKYAKYLTSLDRELTINSMRLAGNDSVPAGGPFMVSLPADGRFVYSPLVYMTSVPAGGLFVYFEVVFNVTAGVSFQVRAQLLSFCATADALDRCGHGASCIRFSSMRQTYQPSSCA